MVEWGKELRGDEGKIKDPKIIRFGAI